MRQEENELLTRVGPGTKMGRLLRRYWWPVGFSEELGSKPLPVRLLGEDLVLFRQGDGTIGLTDRYCAHRRASLELGRVESNGIRCCYHGWLYGADGRCLDMPAEPADSKLKDEVRLASYATAEAGGLIFANLGPQPVSVLPPYDLLVRKDLDRIVWSKPDYCNWLQRAENGVDQCHSMALHASVYPSIALKRPTVEWQRNPYGFRQSTKYDGGNENISHHVFPSHTRRFGARVGGDIGHFFHFRVPTDDTETLTFYIKASDTGGRPGKLTTKGHETAERGVYDRVEDGWWGIGSHDQDRAAQESQGLIADRTRETLASSDRGIIMLRRTLMESLEAIEKGEDPFATIRDPNHPMIVFDAKKNFSDAEKELAVEGARAR